MLALPASSQNDPLTRRQVWLLLLLALTGSFVIHTPNQLLISLVPNIINNLSPQGNAALHYSRALLFLVVTATLLAIIGKPIVRFVRSNKGAVSFGQLFRSAFIASFVLSVLILPATLGIMGVGYAELSYDPFTFNDGSYQLYQRLMMPALAYFLQFKGPHLYHIFSLIITFLCIFGLLVFFETRKTGLSLLETISLSTTCVVATQFQSPGYTESLVLLAAIVLFSIPMNSIARLSLVLFSLFVHESSVLLFAAVAFIYFDMYEKKVFAAAVLLYGICWIVSFGFDIGRMIEVRNVGGMGGLQWLLTNPFREVLGIAVSYKVLWILFFVAAFHFRAHLAMFALLLLPGVVATVLAVDTTRLMTLSFLPILFSIEYVKRYALVSARTARYLHILNIIIPAVYVGLNSGTVFFDGLYRLVYQGVFMQ